VTIAQISDLLRDVKRIADALEAIRDRLVVGNADTRPCRRQGCASMMCDGSCGAESLDD
jgi:hypothetical protein